MRLIRTTDELRSAVGGDRPAFVPTMGALHQGHLALIRKANELAAHHRVAVVVSVFVNPTQFAPGEDFARYPRNLEADMQAAASAGAELVFAPEVDTMYPPGQAIAVPPLPPVATQPQLEDAFRPGHFAGVCQVVARLLDMVQPSFAVFGEKDFQQLLVVQAMVEQEGERWPGLEIVPHPTIRERDGLAMSSRNVYLDAAERERALGLYRALQSAFQAAEKWITAAELEQRMRAVLLEPGLSIDYAVVRDAATLMPIERLDGPVRALIAARLGKVRLIDNLQIC